MLEHSCDFGGDTFFEVLLNHLKNPNINSSHLFRADILYDSLNIETAAEVDLNPEEIRELQAGSPFLPEAFVEYETKRTLVRRLIPRNPQLDKPIAQTCRWLQAAEGKGETRSLVVLIPHVSSIDDLPWYHPAVQALAYMHVWKSEVGGQVSRPELNGEAVSLRSRGLISLHFLLFAGDEPPLSDRLHRTAHNLLDKLHKHGQGSLAGYTKRVHHDQVVSQKRVQDTYTQLKLKHSKRLFENWVEQTEPSKHVFEDLGIAAFLIELWKDMYRCPSSPCSLARKNHCSDLPLFLGSSTLAAVTECSQRSYCSLATRAGASTRADAKHGASSPNPRKSTCTNSSSSRSRSTTYPLRAMHAIYHSSVAVSRSLHTPRPLPYVPHSSRTTTASSLPAPSSSPTTQTS